MIGPEMGLLQQLGRTNLQRLPESVVDEIATDAVQQFLASVDPIELEVRALSMLGGLEGEDSVGDAMLKVLHEMAGL